MRPTLEALPQLSEFDVTRHFTRLSKTNVSFDAAMYPLGSCTMKYNPRINETVAQLPGLAGAHPLLPDELAQGSLEILHRLTEALTEGRKRIEDAMSDRGRDASRLKVNLFGATADKENNEKFFAAGADRIVMMVPSENEEKTVALLEKWADELM